jgi:hypothetical protein
MDKKFLRCFVLAGPAMAALVNAGFAQANPNAHASELLFEKVMMGIGVWLVTAILAFAIWALVKVIAKIAVIVLPIVAGIAAGFLLSGHIGRNAVFEIGVPLVIWGGVATLICYMYANIFDLEREITRVEQESVARQGTTIVVPKNQP